MTTDETQLLGAAGDGHVYMWTVTTGALVGRLIGHTMSVSGLALLGGNRCVTGGSDKTVRVWNLNDPSQPALILEGHGDVVYAVATYGSTIVSGGQDQTLRIWDLDAGGICRHTVRVRDIINCVGISQDGQTVATGGWMGRVRFWSLQSGNPVSNLYQYSKTSHTYTYHRKETVS